MLDPGHTPPAGGALGARGIYEVVYNDRFAAELKVRLERHGWKVMLTRKPDETVTLQERAELANRAGAELFLSIHHDSARPQFISRFVDRHGVEAQRTLEPFRGYSLYVSLLNPRFTDSLRFAKLLGRRILPLGRPPALYHADPVRGENRPLLDARLGVYRYDGLAVLRLTRMSAALLEVGVIPDEVDEAWLENERNRKMMEIAVVRAVLDYWRTSGEADGEDSVGEEAR
ncbi:MAG: N-acetylmuramoyl-L-alanine amidase, partial [bacterium]|nr:N-acetylmuramoyl-L-alanine amidase [bacterium]